MKEPVKILAVDDEPDVELLIKQRFRQRIRAGDLSFRFARHGQEALAALEKEPGIQLLLTDINMPVMDGLTLLNELRTQHSDLRAVVISAYGDLPNIRTAMNRGAFDFVTKPVDFGDLEITIDKALDSIAFVRALDRRRADAERARSNLARYFSPNIVDMLAESDEPLSLVRRQNVAAVFIDIAGFTRMSEEMQAEEVIELLREFQRRMGAHIIACGGTIEKYVGDEIFAVFGVPDPSPHDAMNALRCGKLMLDELNAWNELRRAAGAAEISVGIGVNYGAAVIGDVGDGETFSFTVIGDTINVASRLQGLTREQGAPLAVADAVMRQIAIGEGLGQVSLPVDLADGGEFSLKNHKTAVRVWFPRSGGRTPTD